MEDSNYYILILPLITSILLVLMRKKLWSHTSTKLPPGPWKLPIIGNLHQLWGDLPHRRLRSLAQKYGPIFHLKLGEVHFTFITSRELAAQVMKTQDINFASRPVIMGSEIIFYNAGDIVFAPYGKRWTQLRKICTVELFSDRRVKNFRSIMAEEANDLVEKIRMAGGAPVDMTKSLMSLSHKITSRTSFGKDCTHQPKLFSAVKAIFKHMSGLDLPDLFPSLRFLGGISGMRRELETAHRLLDSILDEILEEHRRKNGGMAVDRVDEDLVDVLLRLRETGQLDASIMLDNIKAVILDIILGGTETVANIIEWAMSEIIRHPEIMRKAQLEVRNAFSKKSKIHEEDVTNLPYLNMIIKETLRLQPPAPFLVPRHCHETTELGGYTIPAGSRLIINAWAIMRDPSYWDDADSFKPERVEADEQGFSAARFQYIPFGGGRRICPGISFGMAKIEIVLSNLLYHFDWQLPGGKRVEELDMEESVGLALSRKNALSLVAIPHKAL